MVLHYRFGISLCPYFRLYISHLEDSERIERGDGETRERGRGTDKQEETEDRVGRYRV